MEVLVEIPPARRTLDKRITRQGVHHMRKLLLASILALAIPSLTYAHGTSTVGAGTASFGGSFSTSNTAGTTQGFSDAGTTAAASFKGGAVNTSTTGSFDSGSESNGAATSTAGAVGGGFAGGGVTKSFGGWGGWGE
jgi:hypothetical protein